MSLTAYLASASVAGLAIGFGSQGVVQDVVTGLTFIFSDLVDVGDLVEVSGQTGIVRAITMRFVELENALGASVFIPNRTINNVINYPRGYVRCLVDVTLTGDADTKNRIEETALTLMGRQRAVSRHHDHKAVTGRPPRIQGRQGNSQAQVPHLAQPGWRHRERLQPGAGGPAQDRCARLSVVDGVDQLRSGRAHREVDERLVMAGK